MIKHTTMPRYAVPWILPVSMNEMIWKNSEITVPTPQVSQEKLLQYIHFNRHYNTLLVRHNTKLIEDLRTGTAKSFKLILDTIIKKNGQISKLRTDVDNMKSEHSPLPYQNTNTSLSKCAPRRLWTSRRRLEEMS